jgi:glycosyltransferase involved in cell wall biosynthesis
MLDAQIKAEVSVVIPCYNSEKTIIRAINSIKAQTLSPYEVIIVDDASQDNSVYVVNEFKEKCLLNIQLITLIDNKGAANARNVGWNASTQKYIAFLDADDAWHPNKLEVQYNYMQNNPDIALSGHESVVVSDSADLDWNLPSMNCREVKKNKMLLSNHFVTPSVMLKREIYLRFDAKKRYMEDYLLWLQIAFEPYKIVKLNSPLVALFKPMYGESGLSSNMWAMEKAELFNYFLFFQQNKIGVFRTLFLLTFSIIKFFKRLLVVRLRKVLNAS